VGPPFEPTQKKATNGDGESRQAIGGEWLPLLPASMLVAVARIGCRRGAEARAAIGMSGTHIGRLPSRYGGHRGVASTHLGQPRHRHDPHGLAQSSILIASSGTSRTTRLGETERRILRLLRDRPRHRFASTAFTATFDIKHVISVSPNLPLNKPVRLFPCHHRVPHPYNKRTLDLRRRC
jgi:hypothetical protein